MTKDERKYYKEYFNKLDENYMRFYHSFNRRIKYAILDNKDLGEIKLEILEMLYRNQSIGKKVEDVIEEDKDKFFRDIIESYYESDLKLNLIKGILKRAVTFSLFYIIFFSLMGFKSAIMLLSIPISILIYTSCYLVNRYINNTILREVLNLLVYMGIFFPLFTGTETYKNMYIIPNYIIALIIIILLIIAFFLHKKKKNK